MRTNGRRAVTLIDAGHRRNDGAGFVGQVDVNMVAGLFARVLHVPYDDPVALMVTPAQAGDFFQTSG